MRVSEIAEALDLTPSTTHHHLATLHHLGYTAREGDAYALGLNFLTLGGYARTRKRSFRLAMEKATELAHATGERAQFLAEEDGVGVWVIRVLGENAVLTDVRIGLREPLHTTAAGKAILANLPNERVADILDRHGLERRTEHTITDEDVLFEELETVRDRGFAINAQERIAHEQGIGAAIHGRGNEVIGALSVSAPTRRWDNDYFNENLPELLLEARSELELDIRYR